MTNVIRERYRPQPMAANSTYRILGPQMGGFLTKTTGTITIVDVVTSVTLVDAVPLTAGVYTPIPISFGGNDGATVTLAGGASGTLMV